MARTSKRRRAFLALVIGASLGVAYLRTESAALRVCATLRERAPEWAGVNLTLGRCVIEPLALSARLEGVRAEGLDGQEVFRAESAEVGLGAAFLGSLRLDRVVLIRPSVSLRLGAPSGDGASGCFLDGLRRVRIEGLRIEGGRFDLQTSSGHAVSAVGIDATWERGRRGVGVSVSAKGGRVQSPGLAPVGWGSLRVEGRLDEAREAIEVEKAEASIAGAHVSLSGDVDHLCDAVPHFNVKTESYAPLEALRPYLKDAPAMSGKVWLRGNGRFRDGHSTGRLAIVASEVRLGPTAPGDFSAEFALADRVVELTRFESPAGAGKVRVTGRARLEGEFPLEVTVDTDNASFGNVMQRFGMPGVWVEFGATVKGTLKGHVKPTFALEGDIEANTGPFVLAARPFDAPKSAGRTILEVPPAKETFHYSVTPERSKFSGAVVATESGASRVRAEVTLFHDSAKGFEVQATSDALSLTEMRAISDIPWEGVASARFALKGPYGAPRIEAHAAVRDFVFSDYALGTLETPVRYFDGALRFPALVGQRGQTPYSGQLGLEFADEGLRLDGDLKVLPGRAADLVDVLARLHPSIEALKGQVEGKVAGAIHLGGPAATFGGAVSLDVEDLSFYGRRLGAGHLVQRFEDGARMVSEPAVLHGPMGESRLEGAFVFRGPFSYVFSFRRGALAELLGTGDAVPLGGTFDMRGEWKGDSDVSRAQATLTSTEVLFKDQSLGRANVRLELDGREVRITGEPFEGATGTAHAVLKEPYAYTAELNVSRDHVAALLPETARRQGMDLVLEGALKVDGTLKGTDLPSGSVRVATVQLLRNEVLLENDGILEASFKGGRWDATAMRFKGTSTRLDVGGFYGPVKAGLRVDGHVDLRLLEAFNASLERASGKLELSASLSGTVERPSLQGRAELVDGAFTARGFPLALRSLGGAAEFSQSHIGFRDVKGFLNDGKVRLRGDIRLDRLSLSRVEVGVDIDEATFAATPDFPTTLSGALLFYGGGEAFQLGGTLSVVRAKYTKALTLESLLKTVATRPPGLGGEEEAWLRLDVDVLADGDVAIDNNLAKARLTGKVKVAGDNTSPRLIGRLDLVDGAQASFRGNVFSLQRGWLLFTGSEPTFDLSAKTQVREYAIGVKAFGSLNEPKVLFSAEPSLPESDVLALLTLGVTSREGMASAAGAGLAAEALFSATGLDQQVQRFLSKTPVFKDTQVHLSTTFNEATGQAEPSVSWESKVLTDQLKINVTQPVTGRGTKAAAEYRFTPRVSARAQWDNTSQESSYGNPGLDLKFRFESE